MLRWLAVLAWVALVASATDAATTRARLAYRPAEAGLFLQTLGLWTVFALLAWPCAALWARRRAVSFGEHRGVAAAGALAFTVIAPVLAHRALDAYSALGGDLALLKQPRPWLEAGAWLAALWCLIRVLEALAMRTRPAFVAVPLLLISLAAGVASSWSASPSGAQVGLASDPAHAKPKRPNLLLLIWDTTRAQSLSVYGYDRATTPNLEALARDSVVFETARSASRYTLTSHLSMLTGVYPSDHGARMTRQELSPRRSPSIAGLLRREGYRTGAFVGTGVLAAPTGVGFGFEHYDDAVDPPVCDTRAWALVHDLQSLAARFGPPWSRNGQPHWIQDFFRPADQVLSRARAWIETDDGRPWFCMINLYDVHWPYLPEESSRAEWVAPYDGIVDGYHDRSDRYPADYRMQPRDDAHLRELYDAEMAQLDAHVDAFLGALEPLRADTAVLVTADHGEAFGEGGLYEHNDILEPQVRIPFVLRPHAAANEAPRRVPAPVSGVDVAPTLLSLAGVPIPAHVMGRDVLALARDVDAAPRTILVEDRDQLRRDDVRLALYRGPWKLVRRGLGERQRFQLFDLSSDPVGLNDVSDRHPDVRAELERELNDLRARWGADDFADQRDGGFANPDALGALGYTGH